jgi:hypothetical protein
MSAPARSIISAQYGPTQGAESAARGVLPQRIARNRERADRFQRSQGRPALTPGEGGDLADEVAGAPARRALRRAQSGMAPAGSHLRVRLTLKWAGLYEVILAPNPDERCEIAGTETVTSITSRMGRCTRVAPESHRRTAARVPARRPLSQRPDPSTADHRRFRSRARVIGPSEARSSARKVAPERALFVADSGKLPWYNNRDGVAEWNWQKRLDAEHRTDVAAGDARRRYCRIRTRGGGHPTVGTALARPTGEAGHRGGGAGARVTADP